MTTPPGAAALSQHCAPALRARPGRPPACGACRRACGAAPTRMPCSRSACGTSGSMILSLRGFQSICQLHAGRLHHAEAQQGHHLGRPGPPGLRHVHAHDLAAVELLAVRRHPAAMQAMQPSRNLVAPDAKQSRRQCVLRTRLHPGLSSCLAALCCRTFWQLCRKSCSGVTRGCCRNTCARRGMLSPSLSLELAQAGWRCAEPGSCQPARCCACQAQALVQASQAAAGRRLCCA